MKIVLNKINQWLLFLVTAMLILLIIIDSYTRIALFPVEYIRGKDAFTEIIGVFACYLIGRRLEIKRIENLTLVFTAVALFNYFGFWFLYRTGIGW
jgi:hypothetical protein